VPSFGTRSRANLATCHPLLQDLGNEIIKHWDCAVIVGRRGEAAQTSAFLAGHSMARFGESAHNYDPSMAFDIVPWRAARPHIDWNDMELFRAFGGFVLGVATMMEIPLVWGGDWDNDREFRDQRLIDLPHFEIANWREMVLPAALVEDLRT